MLTATIIVGENDGNHFLNMIRFSGSTLGNFTMSEMKTCVSCKQTKPKTDEYFFYRNKEKGYLSSWCKECRVTNRAKTKERELEAQRIRRSLKVSPIISRVCIVCSATFIPTTVDKCCDICKPLYRKQQRKESKCIYKSRLRKATPKWADKKAIKGFYLNCPEGYEVDHIVPIRGTSVSGLHVLNNLQYLTREQNLTKNNRFNDGNHYSWGE